MKFIDPVKFGKVKERKDKKIIYEPESDDFIIAPYDGVIDEIQEGLRENRNGFIRIKHSVDGETYYSEISGLKDITTQRGVDVSQKDKLSRTGNYLVEYEIKNKSKDKVSIGPFFTGDIGGKSSKELKKSDSGSSKSRNDDNDSYNDWNKPYRKIEKVPDIFTSLFLSPINLAYKALTDFSGKKENKDEKELNEEVKRIRQLLK
jgi:hypothetical protein